MSDILLAYRIMILLLLIPLWMFYRMKVSKRVRQELHALLLHDIIKGGVKVFGRFVVGAMRLFKKLIVFLVMSIRKLF
jgi:hypothetical protein